MDPHEIEALLDRVPLLATPARTVEPLSGGLTNTNVKVATPDGVYVARLSGANAEALGIDRHVEHHNTVAAAQAGAGPAVRAFDPDLGVLVIDWLDGRTLGPADVRDAAIIPRIAEGCRTLHAGPAFHGRFDMFERQAGYLRTVTGQGYRVPDDYADHAPSLARVRAALAAHEPDLVPCNNDLLAENFIDDGSKIWLIDYEYSGMNDPYFELGNIACESHLDLEQLTGLVTAYDGRTRPSRVARARLLGAVGQYGWTLWGAIQHAVSPLDFDFWAWSMERYEGAVRLFTGDALEDLLDQVQRDD